MTTIQINIELEDIKRLHLLLNDHNLKQEIGYPRFHYHDEAAYFRGFFSYFLDQSKQAADVGRSPAQSVAALGQGSN